MSSLYAFKASEEQFSAKLQQLCGRSIELQIRLEGLSTILALNDASSDWNPEHFNEAQAKASPYFRLSWLTPQGKLLHGNPVPEINLKEARNREPKPNLVFHNAQYGTLVIVPNTDYIYGEWLKQRLSELDFGPNIFTQPRPHKDIPNWAFSNDPPDRFWASNIRPLSGKWEYLISLQGPLNDHRFHPRSRMHHPKPPGFPKEFAPFPPPRLGLPYVALTIPIWPIVAPTLQIYALVFGIGFLLFGGFGISIRLTQRALRQELELAQSKANFTAMVSHELKTPVATLRMYSEMLRDDIITDPNVRQEFYGTMVLEAKRLQRLIENILDLGKIESGNKSVALVPSDVASLVKEGIQHAQEAYGSSGGSVEMDIDLDLPEILADWDLASQAIANLVHNAFKYGGSNPEILVRGMLRAGLVEIAVLDRGPGIPAEMHECIFEPYRRLGNEETRTSQGTGLGLALVKACQLAQQGTVEIMNRPGGGSIFTLTFHPVSEGGEA